MIRRKTPIQLPSTASLKFSKETSQLTLSYFAQLIRKGEKQGSRRNKRARHEI